MPIKLTNPEAAMRFARISRRGVIRIGCAWVALRLTLGTTSMATATQEKMSQKEAQYQDSPKDIRMCATCTLFVPPRSCKVVSGEVSPNGWCKLFVIAD
jgi:hypothetical protein